MRVNNTRRSKTDKSENFLPPVFYSNDSLLKSGLERKLTAIQFMLDVIPESSTRIAAFIDKKEGVIDWQAIHAQYLNDDEFCLIQWMKTVWTEKVHVEPRKYSAIWPTNHEYLEAVIRALAEDSFTPYLISPVHSNRTNPLMEIHSEHQQRA